jgi:hypothetical protein
MHSNQTFKFLRSINNKQLNELAPSSEKLAEAVKKEIERRRKKRIPKES